MDEGTVLSWLVQVGDQVSKGDVLLRVDTEKAEIDVEVWHDAVVLELLAAPGDTVPVGTTIARLGTVSASGSSTTKPKPPTRAPEAETARSAKAATAVKADASPHAVDSSFAAPERRRAAGAADGASHLGALRDPTSPVQATPRLVYWPDVTTRPAPSSTLPGKPEPSQSRAQRRQGAVASLMERSNREIPHFHLVRQLDLSAPLAWLDDHNERVPPTARVLPAALLLYAVANAAQGSAINGTFEDEPIDAEHVDLGVAVHVRGGGLMTPVLPAAEAMPLDTLMAELQGVVARARGNRLTSRDLTPATLTVTNLGDSGADHVLGVIRPPERALVGFGRIADRPLAIDGSVQVRRIVEVSLAADHRAINGQAGARFLDALATILTKPEDITLAGVQP